MRRITFVIVLLAGACAGCATGPHMIQVQPGHPASTVEPESVRSTRTDTLKPESVPAMLDNSPKEGVESRPQSVPDSRPPRGGHHGHGRGGGS
jgi:hypothetical protein